MNRAPRTGTACLWSCLPPLPSLPFFYFIHLLLIPLFPEPTSTTVQGHTGCLLLSLFLLHITYQITSTSTASWPGTLTTRVSVRIC
ncbi:piezo-type mechanosensitive ion channel component 2-like [Oreochromis aureus]|uniref:piezo-type mechanosensitive ion channel component 2-like n=1 Tax=Oreochromis aureus TaxID=47969 RepID=UPI00195326AE|nr:piezo-type mechanosensitive ion channel component 2-like [Oreochromis aureus]